MAENRKIALEGEFAGWHAEVRGNISARFMLDIQSNEANRVLPAFAGIVVSHNFKGVDGEPVADILDAPVGALVALMAEWAKGNRLDPK